MKTIFDYVRRQWAAIAAFAVVCVCFSVILPLYDVPAEAALYAIALTAVGWGALGIIRYRAFRERHRALECVAAHVRSSSDGLPEPESLVEEDYQRLLGLLWDDRAEVISHADMADTERRDAFTLWAHQIKTPIAAMRLLLQSGGDADALSEQLFFIEQYADMALVSLRSETMAGDLLMRRYAMGRLVRDAAKKFARSFYLRGLTLILAVPEGLDVLTDEKWMTFVVEQLLSNAVKYTPSGGKVTIAGDILGERPRLRVTDTGIGIREEDLPRIFERGFTGYNGRADKKATGLGLYLCARIARSMGVEIGIDSVPGRGTCATLLFPTTERIDE
ncbi:MAG: sensor histidine kinase [Clostridiaceae bacterium]|nr:sensor histidine kinase [Clostridiaceae bacterium]